MKNKFTGVLIAESGSGFGGTAKYLFDLLPVLKEQGYTAQVLAYGDGPFVQRIKAAGWKVTHQPDWKFPRKTLWVEKFGQAGLAAAGLPQLFLQVPLIKKWLLDQQIGLVHLNNEILTHLPLLIAANQAGCRVVCHLHGWRPMTRLEKCFLGYVDAFVSISKAGAAYFSDLLDREVTAAPNGVPPLKVNEEELRKMRLSVREKWKIAENTCLFTLAGRIVAWKGQDVFLRALAEARRQYPDIKGLILGKDTSQDETEMKRLQILVKELGLEAGIFFIPWVEDVTGAYAASDVVVHASTLPEPFGLVILEAMNAGRPVIAARAGGVVDIVEDGISGLLVEPGDVSSMTNAMMRLAQDRSLAQSLANAGRERAGSVFTMAQNGCRIAEIYTRLFKVS